MGDRHTSGGHQPGAAGRPMQSLISGGERSGTKPWGALQEEVVGGMRRNQQERTDESIQRSRMEARRVWHPVSQVKKRLQGENEQLHQML